MYEPLMDKWDNTVPFNVKKNSFKQAPTGLDMSRIFRQPDFHSQPTESYALFSYLHLIIKKLSIFTYNMLSGEEKKKKNLLSNYNRPSHRVSFEMHCCRTHTQHLV
jgi:hypothetical protein